MSGIFVPEPILADSHGHFMEINSEGLYEVISRAFANKVRIIVDGGGYSPDELTINDYTSNHRNFYTCLGVSPHDADKMMDKNIDEMRRLLDKYPFVGVGETGLDYHYENSPRKVQKEVFQQHIKLSKEFGLPLVVHCREAFDDCFEILDDNMPFERDILFHCFTGDEEDLERIYNSGWFISTGGIITFPGAKHLQGLLSEFPVDRILLESDTPYLAPQPRRGEVNEPAFIPHTAKKLAELKGMEIEDVSYITTLNTRRFFDIGYEQGGSFSYRLKGRLYLNITNRCTNRCSFCVRNFAEGIGGENLLLEVEPLIDEVIKVISNPCDFQEVVFCGYGEPLLRPDVVWAVSRWVKENGGMVRVNTNGCASAYLGYDVLDMVSPHIDTLSVSLNAPDEKTYRELCNPTIENAYDEVLKTIRKGLSLGLDVYATAVDVPSLDIGGVEMVAKKFGAKFKIRHFYRNGEVNDD